MTFLLSSLDATGKQHVWSEHTFLDRFTILVQQWLARTGVITEFLGATVVMETSLDVLEQTFFRSVRF